MGQTNAGPPSPATKENEKLIKTNSVDEKKFENFFRSKSLEEDDEEEFKGYCYNILLVGTGESGKSKFNLN
jgi:hypothetical protein